MHRKGKWSTVQYAINLPLTDTGGDQPATFKKSACINNQGVRGLIEWKLATLNTTGMYLVNTPRTKRVHLSQVNLGG